MIIKYDIFLEKETIDANLKKITNQVYKLLPSREEGSDWQRPLESILIELAGMDLLLINFQKDFFSLMCKLEGLFTLTQEKDFLLFRKIIFESLNLINLLRSKICQ